MNIYSQILMALIAAIAAFWLIYLMLRPLFPKG